MRKYLCPECAQEMYIVFVKEEVYQIEDIDEDGDVYNGEFVESFDAVNEDGESIFLQCMNASCFYQPDFDRYVEFTKGQ